MLEELLRIHGIEVPPNETESCIQEEIEFRDEAAGERPPVTPQINTEVDGSSASPDTQTINHELNLDWLEMPPPQASQRLDTTLENVLPLREDSPPSPILANYDPVDVQSHTPSSGDMTGSLAARMGSLQIAEDGELRYYGPTSNLHILHNGLQSVSKSTIRNVASEGDLAIRRAGLDQAIDLTMELQLARLYFAWEDPAIHVVEENIYFAEKLKWHNDQSTSSYYSATLNNAMYKTPISYQNTY